MQKKTDAVVRQIGDNLYQITLVPPIPGFDQFVSVWVHTGRPCFLVDVGPAVTVPQLVSGLKEIDAPPFDYCLLTHIHIDHAGGVAPFLSFFPQTPVVVHPNGIPHLTEPTRLWKGSLTVLGDIARAYGEIQPVPGKNLMSTETFTAKGIKPIHTPGHSANHVSYRAGRLLFAGEAGGVYLSEAAGKTYYRPATPPRFFWDVFLRSLDLLAEQRFDLLCYGHWGAVTDGRKRLETHRDQLQRWRGIINQEMQKEADKTFFRDCIQRLLVEDPLLSGFYALDPDTQKREEYFLTNAVKGIAQYLETAAEDAQTV